MESLITTMSRSILTERKMFLNGIPTKNTPSDTLLKTKHFYWTENCAESYSIGNPVVAITFTIYNSLQTILCRICVPFMIVFTEPVDIYTKETYILWFWAPSFEVTNFCAINIPLEYHSYVNEFTLAFWDT